MTNVVLTIGGLCAHRLLEKLSELLVVLPRLLNFFVVGTILIARVTESLKRLKEMTTSSSAVVAVVLAAVLVGGVGSIFTFLHFFLLFLLLIPVLLLITFKPFVEFVLGHGCKECKLVFIQLTVWVKATDNNIREMWRQQTNVLEKTGKT
jgi:hypothetical protein